MHDGNECRIKERGLWIHNYGMLTFGTNVNGNKHGVFESIHSNGKRII